MPRPALPKRNVAVEIATLIRAGGYRPGEWLRLVDLEEKLGVKRFDIRAALAELAQRQTLEHVRNRGFRVAAPDRQRLRDMLALRVLLEVEAALTAMPYLDATALALLEARAEAFDEAVADGTTAGQSMTNLAFHDTLYGFAPNRPLVELAIEIRDRARLWPLVLWPSLGALRRSAEGHRVILAALRDKDAALVAAAVRAHILGSAANDPSQDLPAPDAPCCP